jgi:RNA polymerase sigma-70 factor (ECF subfamily)
MTGEIAVVAPVDDCEESEARLSALFDAHHRRLYGLARRLSASGEEARDLVQDTFVRVAQNRTRLPDGLADQEAWLVRVLVNLCRDRWRRSAVRRLAAVMAPAEATPHPEAALVAHAVVNRALRSLRPRRRAIVVMHELEGLTPGEIGRLLGVSAVTVRWHLSRGRRELAQIIRGETHT